MQENVQDGDVVWLKSGGPRMTVKYETINNEWLCTWFIGNEIKEHSFSKSQVTKDNPDF